MPAFGSDPNLAALDLNLLVALDALLHEESVTLAGRRIGLSQPAMSHALARLRELLNDELLTREGRLMRKTELAQELAPAVRRLVAEIEGVLLGRRRFDPKASRRSFRIAASDYSAAVLLPDLIAGLRRDAPGVQVDIFERSQLPAGELARGELDAVLTTSGRVEAPLVSEELFRESFVCVVRRKHPARGRLTLRRYIALDHLLVANPGYGPGVVDCALEARGLHRRVALRVPHFLVAPAIVARTDLVLTVPRRVLEVVDTSELRISKPPLPLEPFAVHLVWHRRAERDPGATWLRERIGACVRSISPFVA
ncbi:MAG TPA: LysR family transcriptional regulator [Polyangiales bacterium]|nr:LysR family transcriptional regulator [Polyangiales bacterium]